MFKSKNNLVYLVLTVSVIVLAHNSHLWIFAIILSPAVIIPAGLFVYTMRETYKRRKLPQNILWQGEFQITVDSIVDTPALFDGLLPDTIDRLKNWRPTYFIGFMQPEAAVRGILTVYKDGNLKWISTSRSQAELVLRLKNSKLSGLDGGHIHGTVGDLIQKITIQLNDSTKIKGRIFGSAQPLLDTLRIWAPNAVGVQRSADETKHETILEQFKSSNYHKLYVTLICLELAGLAAFSFNAGRVNHAVFLKTGTNVATLVTVHDPYNWNNMAAYFISGLFLIVALGIAEYRIMLASFIKQKSEHETL